MNEHEVPSELVVRTAQQLGPDVAGLVYRLSDFCVDQGIDDIDDAELMSPYELYGYLIAKANAFIAAADDENANTAMVALDAIRDIQTDVTLFLHGVRKEVLEDIAESDEADAG